MQFITADRVSRFGLAFVFLYAGIASFINPSDWVSYVPPFIGNIMPLEIFLHIHAAVEIGVGLCVLFGWFGTIVYALATVMLASILLFLGLDDVTFRDVGLAAMALALWIPTVRRA